MLISIYKGLDNQLAKFPMFLMLVVWARTRELWHITDLNSVSSNPVFSSLKFCSFYPPFFEPINNLVFAISCKNDSKGHSQDFMDMEKSHRDAGRTLHCTLDIYWTVYWTQTGVYISLCIGRTLNIHCAVHYTLDCVLIIQWHVQRTVR